VVSDDVVLTQWVVQVNPEDAPGHFVTREWHIVRNGREPVLGESWITQSLLSARSMIPEYAVRLDRDADDHPTILEIWT
jgi:hypothetical protein